MELGYIIGAVLSLLSVILLLILGYVGFRRQRYTRERFAFVALGAIVSIILVTLSLVISQITPWNAILLVASKAIEFPYTPGQPKPVELLFVIGLIGLIIYVIRFLYRDWDISGGTISEAHHQKRLEALPASLTVEGFDELLRILKGGPPLELHKPTEPPAKQLASTLPEARDNLAWHQQARTLFQQLSPSYVFDPENDWHDQEHTWIGSNRRTNIPVAILCRHETPSADEVYSSTAVSSTRFECERWRDAYRCQSGWHL